jgi:hypothetical protein
MQGRGRDPPPMTDQLAQRYVSICYLKLAECSIRNK